MDTLFSPECKNSMDTISCHQNEKNSMETIVTRMAKPLWTPIVTRMCKSLWILVIRMASLALLKLLSTE